MSRILVLNSLELPLVSRLATAVVLCCLGLSLPGCVALNIPSERRHEPIDDGGWLGGWTQPKRLGVPDPRDPTAVLFDDGPLPISPVPPADELAARTGLADACFGSAPTGPYYADEAGRQAEEVPWPRFHPVPTRPVFATSR